MNKPDKINMHACVYDLLFTFLFCVVRLYRGGRRGDKRYMFECQAGSCSKLSFLLFNFFPDGFFCLYKPPQPFFCLLTLLDLVVRDGKVVLCV